MDILLKTAPAYDKSNFDNLLSPKTSRVPFYSMRAFAMRVPFIGTLTLDLGCLPVIAMYRNAFADRERFFVRCWGCDAAARK